MKIIGKTKSGFLVEVIEDELAQMLGHSYPFDIREQLKIGAEFPLSAAWNLISNIQACSTQLEKLAGMLRDLANICDTAIPIFTEIVEVDNNEAQQPIKLNKSIVEDQLEQEIERLKKARKIDPKSLQESFTI